MDLLISANTVPQAAADTAPASGTPGWATDGNPATGVLATDAPAWHYNMMMAELLAIVKAAGITPSNSDWSQTIKALKTIFTPAQYGVAPYSADLATLIGGYPLGAVVQGSTPGAYWVSTAATNTTVPGATGASWKSLFDGLAMTSGGNTLNGDQIVIGNIRNWSPSNAGETLVTTGNGVAWIEHFSARGGANADAFIQLAPSAINTHLGVVAYKTDVSAAVATEATARANADTALQTSINNEVSRAQAAEATKPNLSGSNTYTGSNTFNGSITAQSGGTVDVVSSDGSTNVVLYAGSAGQIAFNNNSTGTRYGNININTDGSVSTSLGTVALASQLPFTDPTIKLQYMTHTNAATVENVAFGTAFSEAVFLLVLADVGQTTSLLMKYGGGALNKSGFTLVAEQTNHNFWIVAGGRY